MIDVPQEFAASTRAREGQAGEIWLQSLPARVEELCSLWQLRIDGLVRHGYVAIVVPVTRAGLDLVLKISWIDSYSMHEALALRTWNGRGAVRLLATHEASGAMLLERLDAERTLETLPTDEAAQIAGTLLRRLAVPAPAALRTVRDEVEGFLSDMEADWERLGRPFPRRLLAKTRTLGESLPQPAQPLIVNHDLHYANVLVGKREPWLVIDPKPLAGVTEFGVAPLVWNRFEEMQGRSDFKRRLAIISEAAELDVALVRHCLLIRTVEYWLWALSVGFTEDPKLCRTLLGWLAAPGMG